MNKSNNLSSMDILSLSRYGVFIFWCSLGNWVFLGLCFSRCNALKIGNLRSSGSGSLFYVYMLIGLRLIDISDSLAWLYIFACGTKFCSLNFFSFILL